LVFIPNQAMSLEFTLNHASTFEWFMHLATDRKVIRYDMRGFGLSDTPPEDGFSLPKFVADFTAVIDREGVEACDIWGSGNSVRVALEIAKADRRVQNVVLWTGGQMLLKPYPAPRRDQAIAAIRQFGDMQLWRENLARYSLGDHPDAAVAAQELAHSVPSLENWDAVTRYWSGIEEFDPADVDCPVLLLEPGISAVPEEVRDSAHQQTMQLVRRLPDARFQHLPEVLSRMTSSPSEAIWPPVEGFLDNGNRSVTATAGGAFRTILFTDVVSSTPLLAQLKDEKMREVMRDHDEVLEAAVTSNGGRVIKTIGDAFMAEFAVPSGAVAAAIAAQRGVRERFEDSDVPVRIRIGINAGEPIEEDGDLHGASVVIAKRLEGEADANGILVSDVVKQAVTGKDFAFEDRGQVQLKGFEEPVRAWALRWE
jgi:class 3 adenylate cyclase/pimeloyl-ACP methyl ester carboxylesterase